MTRALLLGSLLALLVPACGGAIEPGTGSSSSSSSSSSSGSSGPMPGGPGVNPDGPPTPIPSPVAPNTLGPFQTAAGGGCANFTLFAPDVSRRRFLLVEANKKDLGLVGLHDTVTIDLSTSAAPGRLSVRVDEYDRVPAEQMYCTDVLSGEPHKETMLKAEQGTVTLTITAVGKEGDSYAVTVSLTNILVRRPGGQLERIPDATFASVNVGWLPG